MSSGNPLRTLLKSVFLYSVYLFFTYVLFVTSREFILLLTAGSCRAQIISTRPIYIGLLCHFITYTTTLLPLLLTTVISLFSNNFFFLFYSSEASKNSLL
jgi:hypothetical protein